MSVLLPGLSEIESAARLIYRSMPPTPQYSWPLINARAGAEVWVKHDNHTPVGAFKVRGGLVYMDWLRRERPEVRTVVSATRGNHGQSIPFAAAQFGIRVVIWFRLATAQRRIARCRRWEQNSSSLGTIFRRLLNTLSGWN